eukprot:2632911-Rhodomonas_salina.1
MENAYAEQSSLIQIASATHMEQIRAILRCWKYAMPERCWMSRWMRLSSAMCSASCHLCSRGRARLVSQKDLPRPMGSAQSMSAPWTVRF